MNVSNKDYDYEAMRLFLNTLETQLAEVQNNVMLIASNNSVADVHSYALRARQRTKSPAKTCYLIIYYSIDASNFSPCTGILRTH